MRAQIGLRRAVEGLRPNRDVLASGAELGEVEIDGVHQRHGHRVVDEPIFAAAGLGGTGVERQQGGFRDAGEIDFVRRAAGVVHASTFASVRRLRDVVDDL